MDWTGFESTAEHGGPFRHPNQAVAAMLWLVAGLGIVHWTGWVWADPVIAVAIALQIVREGGRLVRDAFEGLMDRVTLIQGTLGKAFGVMGGYITGSASLIDFVRSFASGFIFSTALPPALAAGAAASIRHLKSSDMERMRQRRNVKLLRERLDAAGVPHLMNESHIVPVMVKDAKKCKFISDLLLENYGLYVQPINYPTVPEGTERLRITPTPLHSEADIDRLVGALSELWSQCALARAVA